MKLLYKTFILSLFSVVILDSCTPNALNSAGDEQIEELNVDPPTEEAEEEIEPNN